MWLLLSVYSELTDWAVRDLTQEQLEYAALDAAVTPKLMEEVMKSIQAHISSNHLLSQESEEVEQQQQENESAANGQLHGPVIRRWDGDDALQNEIVSYRFLVLPESTDETTIGKLQAKQIVGPSWIASSVWTAVQNPPTPYELSSSH